MVEKIAPFLREVKAEISKVTWPNKQETIAGTSLVIIVSLILAVFIGLLDVNLTKLINFILK